LRRGQTNRSTLALFLKLTLLIVTFSPPAWAFYELSAEVGSVDLRGMVRGFGTAYQNPDNDFFYEERSDAGVAGIARLIMQAEAGQHLSFDVNVYQTYIPSSLVSSQAGLGTPLDVERSAALEWSFSNDKYVRLAIDRLNARYSHNRLDLIVGRQPINLATTFYFTPNDFFAPFAAQVFYRVYKAGVDAIRAEVRLGDLSQLSLISTLGYKSDPASDTGWSDEPYSARISYLGRISTVFHNIEWALLTGVVRENNIIGGSLQGDLFQWLGVRAEGHVADPDEPQQDSYSELSVGVEHRWENSLNMRLEQFYHGSGAGSTSDYVTKYTAAQGESSYLGRNYTALGIGYEFTPLLNAEMLAIANLTDHSYLLSFNAIYSLSDEAELVANLGVPIGDEPEGAEIKSEFGLSPYTANIEVRIYF
jgi:hypothetical protein